MTEPELAEGSSGAVRLDELVGMLSRARARALGRSGKHAAGRLERPFVGRPASTSARKVLRGQRARGN